MIVITPTGGRPEAFALLARYLNAQTLPAFRWLIVDDCDPATPVPVMRDGIEVEVIRPSWRWQPGQNTQAMCMAVALKRVPDDACVAVCEDDDWIGPTHLEMTAACLRSVELVGERTSRYYNIRTRRARELPGTYHASLASTGCRGGALKLLRRICLDGSRRIDMELWRAFTGPKALTEARNVVGVKGCPGRQGIGVGHRDSFGDPDPHGDVLRDWLGSDAQEYRWFARKAA